jgi:hypothetical protein
VGHPTLLGRGCPIRTSADHSLLAAPRGLSQPSTSFIGSRCQGIHRAPLLARRLDLSTPPSRQDQRSQKDIRFLLSLVPQSPRPGTEVPAQLLFDSSGAVSTRNNKKGPTSVEPHRGTWAVVNANYAIGGSNVRMVRSPSTLAACAPRCAPRENPLYPTRRRPRKPAAEQWSRGDSNP